jgi:CRISPR system Cascade subunit CasA
MLPETARGPVDGPEPSSRPSATLGWLAELQLQGQLGMDHPLRARAVGVQYGSNNSVIDEVVDDAVLLHPSLLADPTLRSCATGAVEAADGCAYALGVLASTLVAAAGGDPEGARTQAREAAYFVLDSPYRHWVTTLRAGVDVQERRTEWQVEVCRLIGRLAAELVEDAGTPAWVGREVRGRHVDAALAERWFWSALRKQLVLAFPRQGAGAVGEEQE